MFYQYIGVSESSKETDQNMANKKESDIVNSGSESEEILQKIILKKMPDITKFTNGPKLPEVSIQTGDLIELAIEIWRLERKIKKLAKLDEDQRENLINSIQKLKRYLDKYEIEIQDHTNQKYNEGQNLDVLAVEKDPAVKEVTILETKEPTILCKGKAVHFGKVIVVTN